MVFGSSESMREERLFLSDRAQLILPYHRVVEAISEERLGDNRIGTTCRGIGPAYEDKIGRRGIRVGELRHPDALRQKARVSRGGKKRMDPGLRRPGSDRSRTIQELLTVSLRWHSLT